MSRHLIATMLMLWATAGSAFAEDRLAVIGDAIILNGDIQPSGKLQDASDLGSLIRANPAIRKVILRGRFLAGAPALDAAAVIEDMGLATVIEDQCTDACIYMFIAGKPRSMAAGAKIGLRRRTVSANQLKEWFEADKLRYGWQDEFGQAAMMYDLGQSDMRWAVLHLVDHGVLLNFALRIFSTPREDMWWPKRAELIKGGVIVE